MFERVYYDTLVDIVKNNKPYRNRPNEYPVADRRHGYKYFVPIYDSNKEIERFEIWYYNCPLLSIYKGDIVEMMHSNYYQGERHFLNLLNDGCSGSCTQGYWNNGKIIFHDERRCGTVYAKVLDDEAKYAVTLPLHQGIKYYMRTDEPITKYDIVRQVVDRKKSHDILSGHKDGFKYIKTYWKTLLSGIDDDGFKELEEDVDKSLKEKYANTFFSESEVGYIVKDLIEKRDYATLGELAFNRARGVSNVFHYMRWRMNRDNNNTDRACDYMINLMKTLMWECFDAYKKISTPCELRHIPSNPMQEIVLRKETV